ncbi:hypothetical protein GCM10010402_66400 [Actinomadura luteofluorescens]|uniref:hypothetical protein n=1 Tax=Actinomadura luteofluorescens TaxID=46163 RepID=UPI00216400BE|nr:hypothetical protein [Actinomadura glauciflava]MCR3744188.1 hypothetical protein [Actinomadura glauciflava]
MTGPEHYRQAERLADMAHHFTYGDGADPVTGAALAAEAQARATLALAAATALAADNMPLRDREAWEQAALTPEPKSPAASAYELDEDA